MPEPQSTPPGRHPLVALVILLALLLTLAAVIAWFSLTLIEAKRVIEPYLLPADAGSTTGGF